MSDEIKQRQAILDEVQAGLMTGDLSIGNAVKRLRTEVTGLKQEPFARMCKISLRTLRQLEQDDGNPTLQTLNGVFRLFGMRVGIVPQRR
ncbi:hypothetical protein D3C76_703320 [compost metagenome]